MSYEQFFGLNDAPFSLAPNPRYLFASASHAAALDQLTSAISRREPLIVLTGEIGTGKTLLCRTVLERLDRKTFASVINDPLLERDELLKQMLQDFGVMSTDRTTTTATSRHDLVHALEEFLSSLVTLNAHAVVIVDEAQHVQPDVLEQIRLLANIDAPSGTMLQIILIGQLDLESVLARPELRQFQQRVSRRIRLEPLAEGELRSYIDHRLAVGRAAGSRMPGAIELARELGEWERSGAGETFTSDAVRTIWQWSGGLPRMVNLLCDRALEIACAQRLRTIDAGLIDAAVSALGLRVEPAAVSPAPVAQPLEIPATSSFADLESDAPVERPRRQGSAGLISVLAVALAVAAVAAWFGTRAPGKPVTAPSVAVGGPATAPAGARSTPPASVEQAAAPAPAAAAPAPAAAVPAPAAAAPAMAAPERASIGSPSAARNPAATSFEIVVASFRTDVRAAAVAAQVSGAGLPVRRRVVAGWQQVIAGPFVSREEADAAHQRLEHAGLPGTQIVSSER